MNPWEYEAELTALIKDTAEKVTEHYHLGFSSFLNSAGIPYDCDSVPLEIWTGIAQCLADASGYRIVLQAAVFEPIKDRPDILQTVEHHEIAIAEPVFFVKPYK